MVLKLAWDAVRGLAKTVWKVPDALVTGGIGVVGKTTDRVFSILDSGWNTIKQVMIDSYNNVGGAAKNITIDGYNLAGKIRGKWVDLVWQWYNRWYDRAAWGVSTMKDLSKYWWDKGASALSTAWQIAKNAWSKWASLAKYGLQKGGSALSAAESKVGNKTGPVLTSSPTLRPVPVVWEAIQDGNTILRNIVNDSEDNIRKLFTMPFEGRLAA